MRNAGYADFIAGEGAVLPSDLFPGGGPTALAEFFGDHIVVNGKLWPKADVEPRNYRMRLLNGSDSRFYALRFRVAASPNSTDLNGASSPIPFWVIGSDQGLAASATQVDTLLINPSERYDIVFDFSQVPAGSRIIMDNIAGDAPFGGDLIGDPGFNVADLFANRQTDRIMAFDVTRPLSRVPDRFSPAAINHYAGNNRPVDNVRKLALFEGKDEFGRLPRISHRVTTATAQCGALTGVHSVGRLDVVSTTPARPSVANASHHTTLSGLATRPCEKFGLSVCTGARLDAGSRHGYDFRSHRGDLHFDGGIDRRRGIAQITGLDRATLCAVLLP